jgi:hypothetical protein
MTRAKSSICFVDAENETKSYSHQDEKQNSKANQDVTEADSSMKSTQVNYLHKFASHDLIFLLLTKIAQRKQIRANKCLFKTMI